MSDRITAKDLEAVCARINRTVNPGLSHLDTGGRWATGGVDSDGYRAYIDVYYIDGAYGGVALHRIVNESGGVTDVFRSGHVTKRNLYNLMHAFLTGYETYRDDLKALQAA